MLEFCFLILLFSLYYSDTLIPISDFQNVTLFINEGYCNYSLSYSFIDSSIFKDRMLLVKVTQIDTNYYLFVYDDYNKLKKDKEENSFDHYFKRQYLSSSSEKIFDIVFDNINMDKTYYITFDNRHHSYYDKETFSFTVLIYSTIYSPFISQSMTFSGKGTNYLFYVSKNSYYDYARLGFKRMTNNILGELQIIDISNNYIVHREYQTDCFEYYFQTNSTHDYNYKYIANLTLISTSQNNDINKFYFYFFQTSGNNDDTQLTYSRRIYNYTKEFRVLKELNLLLDISNIPALSIIYFKYNWEYSLEDSIRAYGYSDKKLAKDAEEGEELYINKEKDCIDEKRMCEDFFRKIGGDTKYVVLKISPLKKYYNDSFNITINYGKNEEYSSGIPFFSTLMGIFLCIPNIIIHILNHYKCQRKHLNILFVILDLIFWVGFSNVISLYIYVGGYFCFYVGIVILAIYVLLSICFYIVLISKGYADSSGWVYFLLKKYLPLVDQAVNENTKLPPFITVKARSFHQESRQICNQYRKVDVLGEPELYYEKEEFGKNLVLKEILPILKTEEELGDTFESEWGRVDQGGGKFKEQFLSSDKIRYVIKSEEKEFQTWKKEQELKYGSWKDDTNFISHYDDPILVVNFKFEFNLYNDTKNDLKNLKSELSKEAKEHDTKIEVKEEFTIPGFKEKIECRPENTFLLDLLYLLIAFIFSLIGFSSIVNFFIFYEERRVDVTIIKSIASSNIYENPYKEQAILEDSINISSNNKKNNNKYGKIYEPLITDH